MNYTFLKMFCGDNAHTKSIGKLSIIAAMFAAAVSTEAAADQAGDAMSEKMMDAFGHREVWATRKIDHITAIVEPDNGEAFLIDFWTRWDKPQTASWVRTRTREQLRVWNGDQGKGWTATREYAGAEANVKEWSEERIAQEELSYKTQFERLVHRIAKREPDISFSVASDVPHQGWLEIASNGEPIARISLRDDGSPEELMINTGESFDQRIRFDALVSFGDHQQPRSGYAGAKFTTYRAELMPNATGVHFGPPKNLMNLDPTR